MENGIENRQDSSGAGRVIVKPAVFVSRADIEHYSVALRHLMVGLGVQSSPAALVCPANAKSKAVLCPSVELVCHPLFRIPVFRTQNRMEVMDKLSKFKPKILHCFSPKKEKITAYVSEQLSLPYIVSVNNLKAHYSRSFLCGENCGGVICSSEGVAEKVRKHYANCQERIVQVNMGAFAEDEAACFSNEGQVTSIVLADELESVSQFESLLNAVRHLAIDGFEFMLAIIGEGRASNQIREMIKSRGLGNIVTLIGSISPIRSVFKGADIFVQLDESEFGESYLLDAMGVGLCVASSNHNKSDLIVEDKTAVLFDPHDELSVYTTLKRLLNAREFARKIAANGQEHIRSNHSVSTMTDKIIEAYRDAQKRYKTLKKAKSENGNDKKGDSSDDQTSKP